MEKLVSATSMGESSATGTSSQRQIPRKWLAIVYVLVGVMFIVGVPISFYSYPVINYNDIAIGVVFGLVILALAFLDWRSAGAMKRSMVPYVILILGIVSIFLFSYTFSTPWVGTYHLYIFPIDLGNSTTNPYYVPAYVSGAANPAEYNVQNYLSTISTAGGLLLLLASLYEISVVRKMPKA